MLSVYRRDWDIDALSLGLVIWFPFVILLCGHIANGQPEFAWLEFLTLTLCALASPLVTWNLYRLVQALF